MDAAVSYNDRELAVIDARIRAAHTGTVQAGTVVEVSAAGGGAQYVQVHFDGSTQAMPVKAFVNVGVREGDRVGCILVGRDWVVAGRITGLPQPWTWEQVLGPGEAAASLVCPAIPASLSHLEVRWSARSDAGAVYTEAWLRVDGETGPNYHSNAWQVRNGVGGAGLYVSQGQFIAGVMGAASSPVFGAGVVDIPAWNAGHESLQMVARGAFWNSPGDSWLWTNGGMFFETGHVEFGSLTLLAASGNLVEKTRLRVMGW